MNKITDDKKMARILGKMTLRFLFVGLLVKLKSGTSNM